MPKIQVDAQGRPLDENGEPIIDPVKRGLMSIDDYIARKMGPEQMQQVPTDANSSENYGKIKAQMAPRQYVGMPKTNNTTFGTTPPTATAQEGANAGYFAGYPKVDAMDKAAALQELNGMKGTTEYPMTDQEAAELRRQALMKKAGY
jgi:hypothetical protein